MKNRILYFFSLPLRSSKKRFLIGVFLFALVIRCAIAILWGNPAHPEMYEHGAIAHNLYTGQGFAMHWPYESLDSGRVALMKLPPQHEGAFLPPLHPYLIYATYLLFGETKDAIMVLLILNCLLGALIPFAIYKISILFSDERGSRIAAVIAACFLPAAFSVTTFSGSCLYQLLVLITLYYLLHIPREPRKKYFILAGIATGLMILLRSEFLLLGLILLLLSSILAVKRFGWRRVILPGLLSLTLATVVVAPWTYRNYRLFGTFVPVLSHPWFEIWRGNNAIAVGTTLDENGKSIWVEPTHFPHLIKEMDSLPYDATFEIKTDAMFKREVLQFWSTEPSRAISLALKKLAFFFTIDFNHPASGSPFYFISMIAVIIGISFGYYRAFRDRHQEKIQSVLLIYSVFLLFYLSLTAATVMLPRYQIYVWTAVMPMISLLFTKSTKG